MKRLSGKALWLTALLDREGIEHFGPHKPRAAVAARLESLGVPHKHIQAVLNHVRQDVTSQHYAKYDPDYSFRMPLTPVMPGRRRSIRTGFIPGVISPAATKAGYTRSARPG
ncbi:tyrosine-type recombinase/integrase [Gammaproteobacteria bacterium]|nr:tyrosine-type recombinase/integrase [Gammaproteobacteria bacterium]